MTVALPMTESPAAFVSEGGSDPQRSDRWRHAVESAPVGVWDCDFQRRTLYCSAELVQIVGNGSAAAEYPMEYWTNLIHAEERDALAQRFQAHLVRRTPNVQFEHRILHADGRYRWVRSSLAVISRNEKGEPARVVGTLQSIDDVKQAQLSAMLAAAQDQAIFHTVPVGLAIVGLDSQLRMVNDALCELLGYSQAELMELNFRAITHRHDLDEAELLEAALASTRERFRSERRFIAQDRSVIYAQLDLTLMRDSDGAPLHFIVAISDRTEERLQLQMLTKQRELAQITLSSIADGVVRIDESRRITYANPAACHIVGLDLDELRHRPFPEYLSIVSESSEGAALREDVLAAVFDGGETLQFPSGTLLRFLRGREIAAECSAAPIKDALGHVREAVFVFHDTTESHTLAQELAYQASHDMLTGLCNRRQFQSALEKAHAALVEQGTPCAVLFIDLDGFKAVNDRHGHQAGDDVLVWVASVIRQAVFKRDIPARWGGDEFAVLLINCDAERAYDVAKRIEAELTTSQVRLSDYSGISGSIGIACMSASDASCMSVANNADLAASIAKGRGGGGIQRFEDIRAQIEERRSLFEWRSEILQSLKEGRLIPYGQKIVGADGELLGYEMLLRWIDAAGRINTPERIIAAAERLGWSTRIDGFVFGVASRLMQSGQVPGHVHLAVNISGRSLADADFRETVTSFFRDHPEAASRLTLEVTETAAVSDLDSVGSFVSRLRDLGCVFALDDFGSGFASFSYLKAIPFSAVKIDRAYIRALDRDPTNQLIVRNLCELGGHLGVTLIAEGVETREELAALKVLGVSRFQGWLFQKAEPLPWSW
jgi:diguanylate cyclase (GGDEF)-like protein/PAS domain S-box-containing protein